MSTRKGQNVCRVGEPGSGKSKATSASVVASDGAEVVITPHEDDLSKEILPHLAGNVLYARLSDLEHSLGFEMLRQSANEMENHRRAEAFVSILLRRRGVEGMASTPLMEEWVMAVVMLFLFQAKEKPIGLLPYALLPGTSEFEELLKDCTLKEISIKFRQLEKLSTKGLRAEVGSAARLINAIFRSPAFVAWSRGGFDLGTFLEQKGKLLVERGEDVGDDTMRTIMAAIILLVIDHAKRRKHDWPTIRVRIDEATNAGLLTNTELKAAAEHNKKGLYFEFNLQRLDVPGSADDLLQLCHRHEWYRLSEHGLGRKAAIDIIAGLPESDESRAQRIDKLTREMMNLNPGECYVRDKLGSRKEYVPLLQNPWPDWPGPNDGPGLRELKLQERIRWIQNRPEYHASGEPKSESSSKPETPPSNRSRDDSSPATRLKRREKKLADGSAKNDAAGEPDTGEL